MIEIVPQQVDSALLYFHHANSSGDELAPFADELRAALPHAYIWAGDGVIDGDAGAVMGAAASYGAGARRFWFVFPLHDNSQGGFAATVEPMGAVLTTCGAYINAQVDHICARFGISAAQVVLCGHQHGACVALAAAMMRRADPFKLSVLLYPWPQEAYYLEHEQQLPDTRVVCIDNAWIRAEETRKNEPEAVYLALQRYGVHAEGITLADGQAGPDEPMFRALIEQVKAVMLSKDR